MKYSSLLESHSLISDSSGKIIYAVLNQLGSGSYGKCFKVRNIEKNEYYACKMMAKPVMDSKLQHLIENEIDIHQSLKNPNIVEFIQYFYGRSYLYIILSICDNNSLSDYVRGAKNLMKNDYAHFIMQILKGVAYIHNRDIIHRDIKAENVLLDSKMVVKICDFGLAIRTNDPRIKQKRICGTLPYIAPEVFEEMRSSFASDIWAIGVLTYKLFFNRYPFAKKNWNSIENKLNKMEYYLPENCDADVSDLLKSIFVPSLLRSNANRCLNSKMFKSIGSQMEQLPWTKKEWKIYVTEVNSIDDVRGIFYEQDKNKLNKVLRNYETMLSNKEKMPIPSNFRIGGYYCTKQIVKNVRGDFIKRIKILDFEQQSRKAKCALVDLGITAWIEYDRIFEISPELLTISEQSTRFSLADIDILISSTEINIDNIKRLLEKQHLIVEAKSLMESCLDSEPKVKAIFHQMRNGKKINLNVEIGIANSKWFEPINFDMHYLIKAMVTHFNYDGTIYCHFSDSEAIRPINRLIKQLPVPEIVKRHLAKDLTVGEFYLVFDDKYNDWFRADLIAKLGLDIFVMKFLDYGQERSIHKKNIYDFKLCAMLKAFPPQAIPVRILKFNGPTNQNRINFGDIVYIDVVKEDKISLVNIWKVIDEKFVQIH